MPSSHLGGGAPLSPQVSRSGPSQSRFVEGSMNDRVSAVPPPSFLGPGEMAAYEKQFYLQPIEQHSLNLGPSAAAAHTHTQPRGAAPARPTSSAGQSLGHGKKASSGAGWFAPLWGGMKERLHLSRSRSSGEIATGPIEKVDVREKRAIGQPTSVPTLPTGPPPLAADCNPQPESGLYPSREEVMESYKNLVASGFFSAHAIRGTRHPLPHSQTHAPMLRGDNCGNGMAMPTPTRAAPPPPPRPPPPPPPASIKPFAEHMAGRQHQQVRRPSSSSRASSSAALAFSSVPYTSTRPPTADEVPTTVPPPPRDAARPSTTGSRPSNASDFREHLGLPPRGTKRGAPSDAETHARKLVKKLRKSASRLSADLSLPSAKDSGKSRPVASAPGSATSSSFPANALEKPSMDLSAPAKAAPARTVSGQRTPTKLKKRGIFAGRRHHSASHRPRSAGRRSPGSQPEQLQLPRLPPLDLPTPDAIQSQPASGRTSMSSLGGLAVPSLQPRSVSRTSQDSRSGRLSQDSRTWVHEDSDAMEIDSSRCSRSISRSVSPEKQFAGLAPPSFHCPYRFRTVSGSRAAAQQAEPLSVVPDVNRGIPVVPMIPVQYKEKLRQVGNRDSGVAGAESGMVGDENNYEISWYRA